MNDTSGKTRRTEPEEWHGVPWDDDVSETPFPALSVVIAPLVIILSITALLLFVDF
jgi:hypothetical protein